MSGPIEPAGQNGPVGNSRQAGKQITAIGLAVGFSVGIFDIVEGRVPLWLETAGLSSSPLFSNWCRLSSTDVQNYSRPWKSLEKFRPFAHEGHAKYHFSSVGGKECGYGYWSSFKLIEDRWELWQSRSRPQFITAIAHGTVVAISKILLHSFLTFAWNSLPKRRCSRRTSNTLTILITKK